MSAPLSQADHERLVYLLKKVAQRDGAFPTALPGLQVVRKSRIPAARHTMELAKLCYVAQGAKAVFYGGRRFVYNPNTILVLPVSLPLVGEIVDARQSRPMLSVSIALDLGELAEVACEMPRTAGRTTKPECIVRPITAELFRALHRYVSLLQEPEAIPVLATAIRRELYYRLLAGSPANRLRALLLQRDDLNKIGRTIAWFRQHAFEPVTVKSLAQRAHMSESSLFKCFKAVTALSPLQFQKQQRLHEARRLLLTKGTDIAAVSYRVGYNSPSQFSREYQRLFKASPKRDIVNLLAQEKETAATSPRGEAG